MTPLIVLVGSFITLRGLGLAGVAFFAGWQHPLRWALALMFLMTASAHWGRMRSDLVRMVPPAFPRPGLLVTLTGVLEIAGAIGLLIPVTAPWAAFALGALLLAMFPANVHAARTGGTLRGRPVMGVVPRGLVQVVFLIAAISAGL